MFELEESITIENYKDVKFYAHKMKSSVAIFGLDPVKELLI